jgi:hypothetical protein
MKLKKQSAWIFTLLVLGLVLVALFPSPNFIAFGLAFLPLLLILQVIFILQAEGESTKTFDDWYEQ